MTIASVIVCIITIYIVFTKRYVSRILISLFALNLIYEGFINTGYFAIISGQIFKVSDFLQLVMAAFSAVIICKRFPPKLFLYMLVITASVICVILCPFNEMVRTFDGVDYINNAKFMHIPVFDMQCLKTTLRLLCFGWNSAAILLTIRKERWEELRKQYFKFGRIVICYAWIEFVIKNFLGGAQIIKRLFAIIFGVDATIMTGLSRNGLNVIIGFNNEPSQFTMMLFSYLIIYIIGKEWENQTSKQKWITLSAFLLMILSGSFRPIGMIPILILLYMVVSKKPLNSIIIACVVCITLVVLNSFGMIEYYAARLGRTFEFLSTLDPSGIGGGEASRLATIVEAFKVFAKRPILGIGPGETFAYGFIPSMLVMTGLFGTMSWYALIFGRSSGVSLVNNETKTNLILLLIISISWIYTDSIAIGYSIYVLAIALEMKRSVYWTHNVAISKKLQAR